MNHMLNVGDVQASCCYISSQKNTAVSGKYRLEHFRFTFKCLICFDLFIETLGSSFLILPQ